MESLLINSGGVALILFILWWFFYSTSKTHKSSSGEAIKILVDDGSYQPARIEIPAGQEVLLRFSRKDASPCASQVVFEDIDLSSELSLNHDTDVVVQFDKPGEYDFTCQMKMYRGTLIVN